MSIVHIVVIMRSSEIHTTVYWSIIVAFKPKEEESQPLAVL
jgi:hypothetical protein